MSCNQSPRRRRAFAAGRSVLEDWMKIVIGGTALLAGALVGCAADPIPSPRSPDDPSNPDAPEAPLSPSITAFTSGESAAPASPVPEARPPSHDPHHHHHHGPKEPEGGEPQ